LRAFVAVDPSAAVRESLERALARVQARVPRWAGAEGLHVTVAFLGEVDDVVVPDLERAVAGVAGAHAPLALRFAGGGSFGNPRRPRVLWVGVTGDVPRLAAVQRDLDGALRPFGYAPEERPFHPHLTLARARDPRGDAALGAAAEMLGEQDFGTAIVDALVLYRSDRSSKPARYTAVARLPLQG
jgi:RNA 2',3'-cyclic 3'-phosphodiesterase